MFLGPDKSNKPERLGQPKAVHQPFFIDFAKAIRSHIPNVPFIVTGGFRSCHGIEETIASGDCDMVGLARPAIVNPLLPKTTVLSPKTTDFSPEINDGDVTLYAKKTEAPWILKQIGIRAVEVHMDNVRASTFKQRDESSNNFPGLVCPAAEDAGRNKGLIAFGRISLSTLRRDHVVIGFFILEKAMCLKYRWLWMFRFRHGHCI